MASNGAVRVLLAVLALACPVAAQVRDPLSASGIRYPEGFDLNTTGDVEGRVAHVSAGTDPVWFDLSAGGESYVVLTVPRRYWAKLGARFPEGAEVVVRGSKTVGRDGNLYMVAQEVRFSDGGVMAFRDRSGVPLWTGPSGEEGVRPWLDPQRGGTMMGPARPGGMGGVGGMGGGMGGGMHRR